VSSEKLLRLANALGASIDYLLRGEDAATRIATPVTIPPELSQRRRTRAGVTGKPWPPSDTRTGSSEAKPAWSREKSSAEYTKDDWIGFFERSSKKVAT